MVSTVQIICKSYVLGTGSDLKSITYMIQYATNNFVISGIKIIGHYGQTATDMVVAKNVLDDYSAIILSNDFLGKRILFRCSSGLGIGSNDSFGGLYFNSNRIFYNYCNGFVEPSVANTEKHPGVLNMRVCGELTTSTEGVYTCRLMNSSMMYQNMSVGVYLNGRSKLPYDN